METKGIKQKPLSQLTWEKLKRSVPAWWIIFLLSSNCVSVLSTWLDIQHTTQQTAARVQKIEDHLSKINHAVIEHGAQIEAIKEQSR